MEMLGYVSAAWMALAVVMFFLAAMVMPVWALIDVLVDRRQERARVVWVVLMMLLWGVTALIYAFFGTYSKALRYLSIGILLFCLGGVVTFFWVGMEVQRAQVAEREERRASVSYPTAPRSLSSFEAFPTLKLNRRSRRSFETTLVDYGPDGFDLQNGRPVSGAGTLCHVATAKGRTFAITDGDFGEIKDGAFEKFSSGENTKVSAPRSVLVARDEDKVYVAESPDVLSYTLLNGQWAKESLQLEGYAGFSPKPRADGTYIGLDCGHEGLGCEEIDSVAILNQNLAAIESIPLKTPIYLPDSWKCGGGFAIHVHATERVAAIVAPPLHWEDEYRAFLVELSTGVVYEHRTGISEPGEPAAAPRGSDPP